MTKRKPSVEESNVKLFLDIIRAAYLGESFIYKSRTFGSEPTLVTPYDFIRKIRKPKSAYEWLLDSLDPGFKEAAQSELYRKGRGWIDQGLRGYAGLRIRKVRFKQKEKIKTFLLPVLSNSSVGIDSSSIENRDTVFAFCCFPDFDAGYAYLERYLRLPKARRDKHEEYKWTKLNQEYRSSVLENFNLLLSICCNALLVIKTNALISPVEKLDNVFIKLIDGCFSGYENMPGQQKLRLALKQKFFCLANNTPIHCDADFSPLKTDDIVTLFVKTLAKHDGMFCPYTPLHVGLKSHESRPIQIADIIVGAIKTKIQHGMPLKPLLDLPFDIRKIRSSKGKVAKAYYWIA